MTPEEAMEPVLAAVERYRDDRFDGRLTRPGSEYRAAVRDAIAALVVAELEAMSGYRSRYEIGQRLAEWRAVRIER